MLNPLISMSAQVPDILGMTREGVALKDQLKTSDVNRRAAEENIKASEENRVIKSRALGALDLQSIPSVEGKLDYLRKREQQLLSEKKDPGDTVHIRQLYENGQVDEANQLIDMAVRRGEQLGILNTPTATRAFNDLVEGFTPEEVAQARRVEAGLAPRASTSAEERIAANEEVTNAVAQSQAVIEGQRAAAKETAKLSTQFELKPKVEAAVKSAVERATLEAGKAAEAYDNKKAFAVYETGMSGLIEALGSTETGPFVGRLPAVTASQQIADGAIAAMAPVLKQLFRASGEGIFTDKDQELLLAMVPKRTDHADARLAKMQNIDAIVRAKLGIGMSDEKAQSIETISDDELLNF